MPSLGPFPHGVSWSDVPTSVISPVEADVGLNVVFGAAPLHLIPDGQDFINKPRIYNSYEEAVAELGFSDDWDTYDICEHMDSLFVQFGMFPVVYVAVNNPNNGAVVVTPFNVTLVNDQADTGKEFIAWTIAVKNSSGSTTYALGTDYLLSLSADNTWIVTRLATGTIPAGATLKISGSTPSPTPITAADVIGGIDVSTGARSGLEVIEDVFQATGKVPGIIICPKWSHDPVVASVMEAKCENVNGCFACTCLIDVDTNTIKKAQDVNAWKNSNNITFARQQLLFGMPALVSPSTSPIGVPTPALKKVPPTPGTPPPPSDGGGSDTGSEGTPPPPTPTPFDVVPVTTVKRYHFASQQGPLMQWVDAYRGGGLPYNSPSNKPLRMNALQLEDGTELPMHLVDANMLNSQGVVTALNFIGGWRSWGNRTAAFPANTDVKDMFIPVRRMFDYIGNTIVLTIWQKVDEPGNRRLIDAITNSLQLWLDGLSNTDALLGARLEFRQSENPTTELLNGHYVFHVLFAAPTPGEWIEFRLEYFLPFLQNLFTTTEVAA